MVRTGGGQSCSCRRFVFIPRLQGKGVCRCFAGEKPNERGRRRREKEGGTLSDAVREEDTHAHTHVHSPCVQGECAKPNNACVIPAKIPLSVNKY